MVTAAVAVWLVTLLELHVPAVSTWGAVKNHGWPVADLGHSLLYFMISGCGSYIRQRLIVVGGYLSLIATWMEMCTCFLYAFIQELIMCHKICWLM